LGVEITDKYFLINIDFDVDVCPYSRGDGCDHPKMFKYYNCLGVEKPVICPLIKLTAVQYLITNTPHKQLWVEE
jgi:hypothetical protein